MKPTDGAQGRSDNRARSAQSQALWDVGFVLQREVAVRQFDVVLPAVIHQPHNQRLDDPDSAVVTTPPGNGI